MRIILVLTILSAVLCLQTTVIAEVNSQAPAVIKLDPPQLDKGIPVMQALSKRQSIRDLSSKELTKQQLSEILWAADGVNRPKGERTAPSAMRKYPVDIYAVLPNGVYLYDPGRHDLTIAASGDYRKTTGGQEFVYNAPLNLVFVADLDKINKDSPVKIVTLPESEKMTWAAIEAGCQAENVYLYCASEGLGATIRASVDKDAFGKLIHARPSQHIICAQTVGVPAEKE